MPKMGGLRVSTVSEKTVGLVSIAQDAGSPVLLAASAPLSLQIVLSGDILEIASALFDTESSIKLSRPPPHSSS